MPYQYGGTGNPSYDCSGLTQGAYFSIGVILPRITQDQYRVEQLPLSTPKKPRDLLFLPRSACRKSHRVMSAFTWALG